MTSKTPANVRTSARIVQRSINASQLMATAFALSLQLCWARAAQSQTGAVTPAVSMGSMDMDQAIRTYLLADQLEIQPNKSERPAVLQFLGWIGGDYQRVFLRAQGEQPTREGSGGELRADVLYGRLITPFWSAVAGVRVDTKPRMTARSALAVPGAVASGKARVTRGMLAVGLVGIAPYWFELEPTVFVSDRGDVSAEFESTLDIRFTQRLILQPRLELNAAVQAVPDFGVGSGLNDVEFGTRLRYEVRRKFAPYIGASWHRLTSGSAAQAKAAGGKVGSATVAVGVRIWR
jgi:copper resistance protein B